MSQSSGAVVSYLGAGIEGEKTALLRVLGTREDREKELLRTTNPMESILSRVRLRTNNARHLRRQDNALYLYETIDKKRMTYHTVIRIGKRSDIGTILSASIKLVMPDR